jgi:ribonuclease HII
MLKPFFKNNQIEAGCDEAGRGCLAGPVFAAAVILPQDFKNLLLNDSKKLSEKSRYYLRDEIERSALAFSVFMIDNVEIDKINILNASIKAMQEAVKKLVIRPEFLLIDGNRFKAFDDFKYQCVVKGDSTYMSIAAASILAKTYRDDYMIRLHDEFPQYNWQKNKGYPTADHRKAILEHGICKYHRKSFKLFDPQLKLF